MAALEEWPLVFNYYSHMIRAALLAVVCLVTACGENPQSRSANVDSSDGRTQQVPPPFESKGPGREFAVLPVAAIDSELQPAVISEVEVDSIYAIVQVAVNEYNTSHAEYGRSMINLDDYRLQLIASTTATQQKEVRVNAFCSGPSVSWKTKLLRVSDGGNCYFRIKVNLTTGTWSDFSINGEA
ncbi:hypothetical protein [Hymenobacter terrestris]|uniref:DUF4783 domain-containing protein n=1 Tax=Hymenobacter terrestris TaxID=2748310 RepID=A0ABX2Q432_9BACT|nr:hypothetical protein [Hymenobacter terrestris]NVO85720.1 hypothetical protein [Hymenobacter terrestris]